MESNYQERGWLTAVRPLLRSAVAVIARRQRLVNFLALRADRVFLGVPARHPDLAAQRLDRRAEHGRVHHVVLVDIVREPLVIAMRSIDLAVFMYLQVALRHYFGAHRLSLPTRPGSGGTTPRAAGRRPISSSPGRPGRSRETPGRPPGGAAPDARDGRGRR